MQPSWHGWYYMGGAAKGRVAATRPTVVSLDVYVRGMDDRLWQKWWEGGRWHPSDDDWMPHDGEIALGSAPTVISRGREFRDVYVRGADGNVYHKYWDGQWNGWYWLGGLTDGEVAVTAPTENTIDLYIRGLDDALYQRWWDGSRWWPEREWFRHDDGFRLGSAPAVFSLGANFRDVYARGADGKVYRKYYLDGQWHGWFGLGGIVQGEIAAAPPTNDTIDLYVRGSNDLLYQKWWNGSEWSPSNEGWRRHTEGLLLGSPPTVLAADNYRHLFCTDANGRVFQKFWAKHQSFSPATVRIDRPRSDSLNAFVASKVGGSDPGVAIGVMRSQQLLHAFGCGRLNSQRQTPITARTMLHLASTGKAFTALGILMLAEAGELGLNDTARRYLPQLNRFGPSVTLRMLLHHTSCLPDYYDDPGGREELLRRSSRPSNADALEVLASWGRLRGRPGDRQRYSNTGYEILGSVIEHVSGQSFQDFMRTRIFEPLGMTDTFSVPARDRLNDPNRAIGHRANPDGTFQSLGEDPFDNLVGAGSIYSTILDMHAFDRALHSEDLVRQTTLAEAFTPGSLNNGTRIPYGFAWSLGMENGENYVAHDGEWNGYRAYFLRFLSSRLSIIVLSNRSDLEVDKIAFQAATMFW